MPTEPHPGAPTEGRRSGTPHAADDVSIATLAAIVESSADLIGLLDGTGRVRYLNRASRSTLGLDDEDVTALDVTDFVTPASLHVLIRDVWPRLERDGSWRGELTLRRRDGSSLITAQAITADFDEDGELSQLAVVAQDITAQKRMQAELAHRATHDWLTGLPNRALLLNHLDLALARAERSARSVGLLFLDVDNLKRINDRFGHATGDGLLRTVGRLLSETMRPSDTVARIGGDEFVVLCPDIADRGDAADIARRIRHVLTAEPLELDGTPHAITASIGIAISRGGDHPEGLLREGDAAMYRAKARGRNRYEVFDERMRSRADHRKRLAEDLADAVERRELVVHYQPAVDIESGQIVSVEALVRWDHHDRGLLAPDEFIGLAEESGLILPIGDLVFEQACRDVVAWSETLGDAIPQLHVNVSPRQLADERVVERWIETLSDREIAPETLCLEITETALMDETVGAESRLRELRDAGLMLAIDDFGTGYGSLQYLRRFPISVLKIDRTFVRGLDQTDQPDDQAIVEAIVHLAELLGIRVIAEGVETEQQLAALADLGCRVAQGFLFAPPMSGEELLPLLLSGSRSPQEADAEGSPLQLAKRDA